MSGERFSMTVLGNYISLGYNSWLTIYICREHLKDKTVVLVTHQLQYVKQADRVIVTGSGGTIKASGTYEQVAGLLPDSSRESIEEDSQSE